MSGKRYAMKERNKQLYQQQNSDRRSLQNLHREIVCRKFLQMSCESDSLDMTSQATSPFGRVKSVSLCKLLSMKTVTSVLESKFALRHK